MNEKLSAPNDYMPDISVDLNMIQRKRPRPRSSSGGLLTGSGPKNTSATLSAHTQRVLEGKLLPPKKSFLHSLRPRPHSAAPAALRRYMTPAEVEREQQEWAEDAAARAQAFSGWQSRPQDSVAVLGEFSSALRRASPAPRKSGGVSGEVVQYREARKSTVTPEQRRQRQLAGQLVGRQLGGGGDGEQQQQQGAAGGTAVHVHGSSSGGGGGSGVGGGGGDDDDDGRTAEDWVSLTENILAPHSWSQQGRQCDAHHFVRSTAESAAATVRALHGKKGGPAWEAEAARRQAERLADVASKKAAREGRWQQQREKRGGKGAVEGAAQGGGGGGALAQPPQGIAMEHSSCSHCGDAPLPRSAEGLNPWLAVRGPGAFSRDMAARSRPMRGVAGAAGPRQPRAVSVHSAAGGGGGGTGVDPRVAAALAALGPNATAEEAAAAALGVAKEEEEAARERALAVARRNAREKPLIFRNRMCYTERRLRQMREYAARDAARAQHTAKQQQQQQRHKQQQQQQQQQRQQPAPHGGDSNAAVGGANGRAATAAAAATADTAAAARAPLQQGRKQLQRQQGMHGRVGGNGAAAGTPPTVPGQGNARRSRQRTVASTPAVAPATGGGAEASTSSATAVATVGASVARALRGTHTPPSLRVASVVPAKPRRGVPVWRRADRSAAYRYLGQSRHTPLLAAAVHSSSTWRTGTQWRP